MLAVTPIFPSIPCDYYQRDRHFIVYYTNWVGGEVRNLYLHVDNVMKCDGTTNYKDGKLRCQI